MKKEKSKIQIICTVLQSLFIYILLFVLKGLIFNIFSIETVNSSNLAINIIYNIMILAMTLLYFLCNYKNKENYNNFKNLIIGLSSIGIYFILSIFKTPILNSLGVSSNSPQIVKSVSSIIYLIIIILLITLINIKSLKKEFEDIKKNHNKYFSKYMSYWVICMCIILFINLVISLFFTNGISGNEASIRAEFKISPIYIFFSAVLFAPIVEEIVFRKSIRNIIKNDKFFIIVSALIFGWLHVVGNVTSIASILYLIPYAIQGGLLAYMLTKTNNIFVSMGFHLLNNGIVMAIQILLLIAGVL